MNDEEGSGYPAYTTDLAPSDQHLFLHRKAFLADQSLLGDQDTEDVVQGWLNVLAATFCDEDITKAGPTVC